MKNPTHSARRIRTAVFLTCALITLLLIFFLIFSLKWSFFSTDPIYSSVFRLHIRANSDTAADQALKLQVRDELLPFTAELFAECNGLDDAVYVANAEKDAITSHINSTLSDLGVDYKANVRIGREEFPERNYGGEIYPAGEYTALIVELGEGEGENWWCVLFPSLCLSVVKAEESVEASITPEQYDAICAPADPTLEIKPASSETLTKYRIKFRFLELLGELFDAKY
jgi:stage II sporulation protein R